jgi:predicted RNA-binding Zn ribbon-like protein
MVAAHRHQFKLWGGHPALDFVNTVRDWTAERPQDYLGEFGDAVRFGETAGLLNRADAALLRNRNSRKELKRLRELRLLLKGVFEQWIAGLAPSGEDLQRLSADFAEAARQARLIVTTRARGSRLPPARREVPTEGVGDAVLRFRIVEAAVALIVSDQILRLKSCPTCGWFFLDTSKNGSRRWCSMGACGSIAKARSYYRRRKAAASRG